MTGSTRIIFLNQMAGPLFRELAEDLAAAFGPSLLLTGHPDTASAGGKGQLDIRPAPAYDRRNNVARLLSWLNYFCRALLLAWNRDRQAVLFIVSNPPFLGGLGYLLKRLRGQRYVVLVYDVYPDVLISLGRLGGGLLTRTWDRFNRLVYQNADAVFTIGDDMARRLEGKFDVAKTPAGRIEVVPCWADLDVIKPLPRQENWFAKKHGLLEKTVVLYSGNLGQAHDIESILGAAQRLAGEKGIHFLFIGEGNKVALVRQTIEAHRLSNVTLLPFQPEDVLPYSLPCGDLGVVAYEPGTSGCMVPSKTYYYMAAGLALLVVGGEGSDPARLAATEGVGRHLPCGGARALAEAILSLHRQPDVLQECKLAARRTAEARYSRANTAAFASALKRLLD